jgi:hypothetical protein
MTMSTSKSTPTAARILGFAKSEKWKRVVFAEDEIAKNSKGSHHP